MLLALSGLVAMFDFIELLRRSISKAGRDLRPGGRDRRVAPALHCDAGAAVRGAAWRHAVLLAPDAFVGTGRRACRGRFRVGISCRADVLRAAARCAGDHSREPIVVGDVRARRGDGQFVSQVRRRPAGTDRRPALAATVRSCPVAPGRRHHSCPWRAVAWQADDRISGQRIPTGWPRPAAHSDRGNAGDPQRGRLAVAERPCDPARADAGAAGNHRPAD